MTSRILGTGSALPKIIATNDYLSTIVETSDEWIRERTGIKERRIATTETTTQLAVEAGYKALENANTSADEIELILVATFTPDQIMPNTACAVQEQLGAVNAVCFDINAACSGFIYALQTAHAYISTGLIKKALIIGAELLSKVTDWKDRSTCVLFGDGAGAAVVGADKDGILKITNGSDGKKGAALTCGSTAIVNSFVANEPNSPYIAMDGQEVFKFAVRKIPEMVLFLAEESEIKLEQLQSILLHQANKRILQMAAKRLNLPEEKFPMNLDRYGNTSAASLAILLDEVNKNGELERGKPFILAGFGGGLTWGGVLLNW